MFFFDDKKNNIIFKPKSVECAYLALLKEDLLTAKAIFESLDSPRARWGIVLISILQGFIETRPTYFEIRNFLEIDLDFLIKNEKINYVESVLGALEFLYDINQEVFKYAARVMLENKLFKAAEKYMQRSKEVFYNDPELHFMLAKYYKDINNFKNADFYIKECLKIVPTYYPAIKIKNEISGNMS